MKKKNTPYGYEPHHSVMAFIYTKNFNNIAL